MSSRIRFIWSRFSSPIKRFYYRTPPTLTTLKGHTRNLSAVPLALGFSLFTWLGFEKELNAEDKLIQNIKHCVLFIQRLEYEKAEQLLHVALRQAQQIQHHLGITYIYDVMANLALEREQLEKAKKLFISVSQRIMADGASEDDSRVIHISIKLARISHLKKDYTTAQIGYEWCLDKLNKAFEKEQSVGLLKLIALTEDWYGRLFLDCGKSDQALKLMIKSLERMKEVPDLEQEHIVVQLNDIATVHDKLGEVDDSIQYLKEAINVGRQIGLKDELGPMHVNLGRIYIKKNMLDEARKNCGHAWKLGVLGNNSEIKEEASICLKQIKDLS